MNSPTRAISGLEDIEPVWRPWQPVPHWLQPSPVHGPAATVLGIAVLVLPLATQLALAVQLGQ